MYYCKEACPPLAYQVSNEEKYMLCPQFSERSFFQDAIFDWCKILVEIMIDQPENYGTKCPFLNEGY